MIRLWERDDDAVVRRILWITTVGMLAAVAALFVILAVMLP